MKFSPAVTRTALILTLLNGLTFSAPAQAQANDAAFEPSAIRCAQLYDAVSIEARSRQYFDPINGVDAFDTAVARGSQPTPFWRYSNARYFDFEARRRTVRERGGVPDGRIPGPGAQLPSEAGFPDGRDLPYGGLFAPRKAPPAREATPPYGRWLSACDAAHGFTPVFWFGAPEPLACAVALYIAGTEGPEHRARAINEARAAVRAHVAANGGDQLQLENAVDAEARARLQRIQNRAEPVNAARLDITACRAEFGEAEGAAR